MAPLALCFPVLAAIAPSARVGTRASGPGVSMCTSTRVDSSMWTPPPPREGDYIDICCRAINSFFEATTLPFVREKATLRESRRQLKPFERLTAPPESPGLSRPVWLVIAASVPTGLLWYGWYKVAPISPLERWK